MDLKLFMVYEIIGRKLLLLNEFQQRVCVYVLDYFAANIPILVSCQFFQSRNKRFLFSATKERTTQSVLRLANTSKYSYQNGCSINPSFCITPFSSPSIILFWKNFAKVVPAKSFKRSPVHGYKVKDLNLIPRKRR